MAENVNLYYFKGACEMEEEAAVHWLVLMSSLQNMTVNDKSELWYKSWNEDSLED